MKVVEATTVDGATVRYIEVFERRFDPCCAQEDAFFVDCGLSYDGSSATAVTGLSHLEGEAVQIYAGGSDEGSGNWP